MPVYLLDVNVLLASAWPQHRHNAAVHLWLRNHSSDAWSTCAITQVGFVRISSNEKFLPNAVSPTEAIRILENLIADPRHVFWLSNIGMSDVSIPRAHLRGHRQVTDAYLLGLCVKNGGKLATLDQGILSLAATPAEQQAIELIVP